MRKWYNVLFHECERGNISVKFLYVKGERSDPTGVACPYETLLRWRGGGGKREKGLQAS